MRFKGDNRAVPSPLVVTNACPKGENSTGSYTCPLVGQYTTLLAAASPAELDGRLVFAGEHTSGDYSGFMNGAVESGNRAAKEIIEPKKEELEKAA
jgi:monoamine oxidase